MIPTATAHRTRTMSTDRDRLLVRPRGAGPNRRADHLRRPGPSADESPAAPGPCSRRSRCRCLPPLCSTAHVIEGRLPSRHGVPPQLGHDVDRRGDRGLPVRRDQPPSTDGASKGLRRAHQVSVVPPSASSRRKVSSTCGTGPRTSRKSIRSGQVNRTVGPLSPGSRPRIRACWAARTISDCSVHSDDRAAHSRRPWPPRSRRAGRHHRA